MANERWLIHDKFNGFLHKGEAQIAYTSNLPSARHFKTYGEAVNYARNLMADNKIGEEVDILYFPIEGGTIRK